MGAVIESRLYGYLYDRAVRILDQPVREAHAHLSIESGWPHAEMTAAEPLELPNRDAEFRGDGSDSQPLRQILLHQKQSATYARLINTFCQRSVRLSIPSTPRSIE